MSKKVKVMLLLSLLLIAAPTLFGQTKDQPTAGGHWVAISAGFSMAIASGLCGLRLRPGSRSQTASTTIRCQLQAERRGTR